MKLSHRFFWVNFCGLVYALISFYIAQSWINDLSATLNNHFFALMIVLFIAIIPGYLNILLLSSLYFYHYQAVRMKPSDYPPISLMIAVYNEEDSIRETFRGIRLQNYPNIVEVIVIDDGSTDSTIEQLKKLNYPNLKIIQAVHGGKANALNVGINHCTNEIIVTIDADTFLYKNALRRIVARIVSNDNFAAVAGHVLVKNERMSRLARLQSWDYMLGISAVKRQQGLFQGTLVAQGAFSAFRKKVLLEQKGWQDRLGEDIVLTWALIKEGYQIGYEPAAIAFTSVPLDYGRFSRQRQRWARGMIEGFRDHFNLIWKRRSYSSFFVALDLFFPAIDFFYTFVFIPGIILAIFGYYYIVGLTTLLVIPINICIILAMVNSQKRFLRYAGVKMRYNPMGMVLYIILYQFITSPICALGYFKEIFKLKRKW